MGLFDGLFGGGSDPAKEAAKMAKKAVKYFEGISAPELEEYILQSPDLVRLLNAEEIGETELSKISQDPKLQAIQEENLARLKAQSEEGLSQIDRMDLEEALGAASAQAKSMRAAQEAEAQRRGLGDSGVTTVAKLLGNQSVANQARRDALEKIRMSKMGRDQAAAQRTNQAAQMQAADFARKAQVGSAADAINRANAMNRQQVAQANLAARQNIANQRANIANMQAGMANQLAQQNFENQMSLASGKAGVQGNAAQMVGAQPAKPSGFQNLLQTGATIAGIGGTGGFGFWGAEDGGITPQSRGGVPVDQKALIAHQKQEAKFKRDYMKKIHNELLGNDNPNGQVVRAEDGIVVVNGQKGRYVEDPEAPKGRIFVPEMTKEQEDKKYGRGVVESGKVKLKKGETLQDVRDAKKTKRVLKGISKLNELLGPQEQERELPKLQEVNPEVKNILPEYKPMNFGNPFAQAAEDGAVMDPVADIIGKAMARKQMAEGGSEEAKMMDMIRSMEEVPAMQDGGTYQAQDGSLLFTSDGSGDIVEGDSYERDRVDARLNSGEMVLNAAQQQRLMDMLRGEISLDELGDDDIVEGVPREYQEDIINGDDDGDIQAKGMNRLLDMLGRK
jgi:hypothetical protein